MKRSIGRVAGATSTVQGLPNEGDGIGGQTQLAGKAPHRRQPVARRQLAGITLGDDLLLDLLENRRRVARVDGDGHPSTTEPRRRTATVAGTDAKDSDHMHSDNGTLQQVGHQGRDR